MAVFCAGGGLHGCDLSTAFMLGMAVRFRMFFKRHMDEDAKQASLNKGVSL